MYAMAKHYAIIQTGIGSTFGYMIRRFASYVKEVLKLLLGCLLLYISLNWTLAKLCIWISFRASLPPYRIDYCCIGGMAGVYFLVYSFMVRITSFPTDMNNLWIDRWYMWQDWIRVALVATDITSLFYIENCKKSKTSHMLLIHGQNVWAELRVSFTVKKRKKYRL